MSADATVLAFDPGGTTGWSALSIPTDVLASRVPTNELLAARTGWEHGEIHCGAEGQGDEVSGVEEMYELCMDYVDTCVLIEDFTLRMFNQDKEILSPVRLTAMLDYALCTHAGVPLGSTFRQQPSEAMDVVTDAYLKQIGMYERKGGMGHARDADRHSVLWMRKAHDLRLGKERRAQWWPELFS